MLAQNRDVDLLVIVANMETHPLVITPEVPIQVSPCCFARLLMAVHPLHVAFARVGLVVPVLSHFQFAGRTASL